MNEEGITQEESLGLNFEPQTLHGDDAKQQLCQVFALNKIM